MTSIENVIVATVENGLAITCACLLTYGPIVTGLLEFSLVNKLKDLLTYFSEKQTTISRSVTQHWHRTVRVTTKPPSIDCQISSGPSLSRFPSTFFKKYESTRSGDVTRAEGMV